MISRWALVLLGAWVLWNEVTTAGHEKQQDGSLLFQSETRWIVIDGFDTSRECLREREAILVEREANARKKGDKAERSGNILIQDLGSAAISLRYICLPDTIDPRAPKSK